MTPTLFAANLLRAAAHRAAQLGPVPVGLRVLAAGVDIGAKVDEIVKMLETIGRPVAILGLVLLALSWIAAGVLPEWAQQNKGVLVKMLMGGILLGIAPDVVSLVLAK